MGAPIKIFLKLNLINTILFITLSVNKLPEYISLNNHCPHYLHFFARVNY
jgi:hypothetical protein